MEENSHGTDSKPAEKFIQIDSIFIDLFSSDDESDGQKCERFSIRGYVSDMRKKDWKVCWPFSYLDDGHKLDQHILSVSPVYDPSVDPQRGKSHWQESSDKAAEGFIFDSCHSLGNFSIASRKAPKQDVINGRTVIDNASNLSCQSSSCDEKEKKLEVADNSTVALISQSEPGCASHGVTEIKPDGVSLILKATEESLAANLLAGNQTPADHLNGQLTLVDIDPARHTVKFHENGDASMKSNESTISSSESAETVGGSSHHCHRGKLHRRRTSKIRLLTELLGEKGKMKAKHVHSSPSDGTPEASVQEDTRYASKCQVTMGENIWRSDHKRQRRLPRSGKCRHQDQIPSSSGVDKKIQTCRGEIENSVSRLGTENALSGLKKTMKGIWSSYKVDGSNSLRKKKSKKFPVVDPYSVSLMPSKVKDQCEILAIREHRSDKEALDSAAIIANPSEFSSRIPYSISLNTMESKSSTSKNPNSSKDPLMVEGPTGEFSWNNGMIRKDSAIQEGVEAMKSRTVANPFQYENYKTNERELHLSLHSYSNPQRDHKRICRREENELPTFLPEQDDTSRVSKFTRNDAGTSNLGDPNPPPYKASDIFYGQGVDSVLNGEMSNLSMPLPRRNVEPHTDSSWSQLQQMDIYSASNGKRTIEAQEPLALKKKQINQRVDLASDSGTSDDILMEIVELMAKNQYERHLPNAETGNCSRAAQVNNYGDIFRNGRGLLSKPENFKPKAQARNGENAANRAEKVVETRKHKSADYFSNIEESRFNTNHLRHNRMLGHNASVHSQEKPSNGIQYSSIGSKWQSCTEITKCNGTIVESGLYNSKVQSSEGCIDHLPGSEQNIEASHIWSSSPLMPDHLPNGFQRFPAHLTGREKISSPRSLQMANAKAQNFHNHHPKNLERHGRHNNFEAYSQKLAESSFCRRPNGVEPHQNLVGSLELYSNETILAMHLLSLMDSGMRSDAPVTAGGMHKSSKKPPIPRPLKRYKFSGMDIFNKTIQDINQFSSAFHDEVHRPATSAFASTFQRSRGFGKISNFSGQTVFKSQNSAKMNCSDPSTRRKEQKLPSFGFRSGGLGTDDRTFPDNGIQKEVVNVPNSEALAQHIGRNSKECEFMAHTRTLQNQKSTFETELCSVNKNPADFSLPEAGNIYMIGAESFNFGRTLHSKNRSSTIYFNNGYERQRSK